MDDLSFDPRSWAERQAKPGAAPAQGPGAPLPEAWRGIGEDRPETPRRVRSRAPLLLAGGLAVLLTVSGVGYWAWSQRSAPTAVPGDAPVLTPAASSAAPASSQVERALRIGGPAELAGALVSAGVATDQAQAVARAAAPVLTAPGELRLRMALAPAGSSLVLTQLDVSYASGAGAVVTRGADGGFTARTVAAALTQQVRVLSGELNSESFYTSAVAAGLTDTLVPEFINAFSYDFNLASEVSPGDTFQVAYEQAVNAAGEPVGAPQLLFAALTTKAKSLSLYRFRQADGSYAWFDGNGASRRGGLMRTPVDGARISSKFGMRFHPVLHYTRLHAGVDFAAPIGTPIYAAMDGTVINRSPTGCAGNMVMIQHANGLQTRYFHLSRYADGLTVGEHVPQGFTIGYIGVTGTCTTGPHLHFEVHLNGPPIDPLSIPTDAGGARQRLDATQLAAFLRVRDRVDVARAQQAL